jgi:hypothetical protein
MYGSCKGLFIIQIANNTLHLSSCQVRNFAGGSYQDSGFHPPIRQCSNKVRSNESSTAGHKDTPVTLSYWVRKLF